jgi:hypothetical protein
MTLLVIRREEIEESGGTGGITLRGGGSSSTTGVLALIDRHRNNPDFPITNVYVKPGYQLSNCFQAWGDVSLTSFETQNPGSTACPI